MNDFYRIEDIAAMSGLSVRTIRGYLAKGILRGEKADGVWRFTQEDFSVFLAQKQVRRTVRAKRNGAVADFLGTSRRKSPAACLIWDWPVSGGEEENYESLYGKVTSIVGNEIELALAELPDDDAGDGDDDPAPVELPGGIVVTQKEPINVESMEYTGESLTFTVPAGTQFYSDGQETVLSAVKKGSVVSVTVDNREDMNIQSIEVLG